MLLSISVTVIAAVLLVAVVFQIRVALQIRKTAREAEKFLELARTQIVPLAHDVTKVIPGRFKGPAFSRGHIIREEDIPEFLNIGKEHVFALELEEGEVHEEEAALRIAHAVAGAGLTATKPKEGRVDLKAATRGILRVNVAVLNDLHGLGDIIIATLHDNTVCDQGRTVAGIRIIPLCIEDKKLSRLENTAREHSPVIDLKQLTPIRVGLIVTGNEVYKGRIKDGFSTVMRRKVEPLGCIVDSEVVVPDDAEVISRTIQDFRAGGSEVIICCSGMSVDPDDMTPEGIRMSGAQIVFYGLPVLPGAMFLYARLGDTPVLGVPACVLHAPTTAFDLLFPRILAGEELTFPETRRLGHGGLCLRCNECSFPVCPFGKQ